MTKERLEEIRDSIEFQMQIQQASGYKSRYDALLVEEIDLYNEVIELQERLERIENYLDKNYTMENQYWFDHIRDIVRDR